LEDPETCITLVESAIIVAYLEAVTLVAEEIFREVHTFESSETVKPFILADSECVISSNIWCVRVFK
jgi:hypothetical protein